MYSTVGVVDAGAAPFERAVPDISNISQIRLAVCRLSVLYIAADAFGTALPGVEIA